MRQTPLLLVVLAVPAFALLFAAWSNVTTVQPMRSSAQSYALVEVARVDTQTTDGRQVAARRVHSTLVKSGLHEEHLVGVTQLDNGAFLVEDATTDETGVLTWAELTLDAPGAAGRLHIVLDPARRAVEVTRAGVHRHWTVPNDLPWIWSPLAGTAGTDQAVATPLAALVVMRGAADDRATRLLDLSTFTSHTILADQLIVPDDGRVTVIVGNDAVDVESEWPRHLHLDALGADLDALPPHAKARALAACPPPRAAPRASTCCSSPVSPSTTL